MIKKGSLIIKFESERLDVGKIIDSYILTINNMKMGDLKITTEKIIDIK